MRQQSTTIFAFYATGGLREMIPIYPLYAVMFGEHGVSPLELSTLFFIWALVGLLTEVPSGVWADTYSRKWLVVASGVFKGAGFLCWYLWQEYWGFALGFVLWGFGSSLRSGAFEALLYDCLNQWGRSAEFTRHYGRLRALATTCVIVGEVSGGLLITYGYDAVLLISALVPLVATVPFLLYVQDTPRETNLSDSDGETGGLVSDYRQHLRNGLAEAAGNPTIRFIFLATSLLLIAHGIFDEYSAPVLFEKGFDLATIAFLAVPIFLAQAIGELTAPRFSFLSFRQQLMVMVVGCLCLVPLPWLTGYLIPVFITVFFFVFGAASILFAGELQNRIASSSRATVTSVVGLGDSLGAMLWFLVFGVLAETSSMVMASAYFALMIIALCLMATRLITHWRIE